MTVSVLFQHTSLGWLVWAVVGGGWGWDHDGR